MELIQKYLPDYEYREHHKAVVAVPPSKASEAMRSLDFNHSWLVRKTFTTRKFLYSTFGKSSQKKDSSAFGSLMESALKLGWPVLEEIPNRELVAGAVTKHCEADVIFQGLSATVFIAFSNQGLLKLHGTFQF